MVLRNVFCSAVAARVVEVLQRGEGTANDPLCGKNYPLNLLPICIGAAGITGCDAVYQQTLHRRVVDHQQLILKFVSPQHPQEIKMLLCLLNECCSLGLLSLLRNLKVWTLSTQVLVTIMAYQHTKSENHESLCLCVNHSCCHMKDLLSTSRLPGTALGNVIPIICLYIVKQLTNLA